VLVLSVLENAMQCKDLPLLNVAARDTLVAYRSKIVT
jgi:hypothetical protein